MGSEGEEFNAMIAKLKKKARTSNAALYALAGIYLAGILAAVASCVILWLGMWMLWGYGA